MVSELNSDDYENCTIAFDENNNALVTLIGKGKFKDKYSVRPTLYLRTNVRINGGKGTNNEPYKLST